MDDARWPHKVVALGQVVVFGLLLFVAFQVHRIRQPTPSPMTLTTEWVTRGGRTDRVESHMAPNESFGEFFARHAVAIQQAGGPQE